MNEFCLLNTENLGLQKKYKKNQNPWGVDVLNCKNSMLHNFEIGSKVKKKRSKF